MKPNYKMIMAYVGNAFNIDRLQETEMPLTNEKEICEAFKSVFHAEYYNRRKDENRFLVLESYLRGLPSSIDIAFANYEIIELAVKWNSLSKNASEKQQYKITQKYWSFMAMQIDKYCRKNEVELFD